MYLYPQLLVRNTVLGFIFSLCIIVFTAFLFSNFLAKKNNEHQQLLQTIVEYSTQPLDITELSTKLHKIQNYHSLIFESDDEVLYQYKNVNSQTFSFITPKTLVLTIKNQNLRIKYLLDFTEQLALLFTLLIMVTVVTFSSIIFTNIIALKQHKNVLKKINLQIKEYSSQPIDLSSKEQNKNKLFAIPELQESLKHVDKLISTHVADYSQLEQEAYIEPLTKLGNRNRFVQFFEQQTNQGSTVEFGILSITRSSELQTVNKIHGYNEGDTYICHVAEIVKSAVDSITGAQVFRLNSSDFATILPNVTLKEAEDFANELTNKFNQYQQTSDLDSVAYTGLVAFNKSQPLGELLALADTGISLAQTQHTNACYAQTDIDILTSTSASYGNQNWRQEIEQVLTNQRVTLLVQRIQPSNKNNRTYSEVLARFINANGEMLPTASFVAMAEKLDKIVAVDKMIIEKTIAEINQADVQDSSFGINISARTIHDEHFLIWLERRLLRNANIAAKLVFEISEYSLQQNIKSSKRFIDMLHRAGSRVTVERFGVGLTSFKFFRDLKPDFIKMDSTYTRDIDEDKNNQYFLRLMIDLAHRLSITVLAESVESQEEKLTLEKLFIDGCQGFYIGKPKKL